MFFCRIRKKEELNEKRIRFERVLARVFLFVFTSHTVREIFDWFQATEGASSNGSLLETRRIYSAGKIKYFLLFFYFY